MVETDAKDMAVKYARLARLQTKNGKNAIQIARLNSQTDKLRQGKGHGVAILASPENIDDQIAKAEAAVEESERKKKDARKNKKDAKKELALKRINDGKAKAVVLYNEKGQPIDIHENVVTLTDPRTGEPVSFETSGVHIPNKQIREHEKQVRTKRSMTADGKVTASTVYPANPTPEQYIQHMKHPGRTDIAGVDAPKDAKPTKNGNNKGRGRGGNNKNPKDKAPKKDNGKNPALVKDEALTNKVLDRAGVDKSMSDHIAVFRLGSISGGKHLAESRWGHTIEKLYADKDGVLYALASKDGKTYWATGYNPNSGFWTGKVEVNRNQARSMAKGMELVMDNTGSTGGSNSCKGGR